MTDLSSLRPTDASPAAVAAAIVRCATAGRGVVAELDRIRAVRASLLMNGCPEDLSANAAELGATIAAGHQIKELTEHLQGMLRAVAPDQIAEVLARERAFVAANQIATWWTQHGPLLLDGLQRMANGLAAIGEWQTAAAQAATPAPITNVTALRSQPVA